MTDKLVLPKPDMDHLGLKDGDIYAGMVVVQIPKLYDGAVLRQDPSQNYMKLRDRKGGAE